VGHQGQARAAKIKRIIWNKALRATGVREEKKYRRKGKGTGDRWKGKIPSKRERKDGGKNRNDNGSERPISQAGCPYES